MRGWPGALLLLCVVGAGLVLDAILRGTATLTLVVIIPIVTGSSPELFGGVALIFVGFAAWAFLSAGAEEDEATAPGTGEARSAGPAARTGGVILIGPIPIFLGGYRPASARGRWAWVAIGLLATIGIWAAVLVAIYLR